MFNISGLIDHSNDSVGTGVEKKRIRDIELRLGIVIPKEFKDYLLKLNYAEIYGDPIYGIHNDNLAIDLYTQNNMKEHFRYGFIEIFNNDIDGTIYIRTDNGKVYDASFVSPIAESFYQFIEKLIRE